MQYQIPQPSKRFNEGVVERLTVHPISLPRVTEPERKQPPSFLPQVGTEGVIPGQSFVFKDVIQQPRQRTYRVMTRSTARSARLDPPQSSLPPWGLMQQPGVNNYALWLAGRRYVVDVVPRFDGAIRTTDFVKSALPDPDARWWRSPAPTGPTVLILGGTAAAPQNQVFPVSDLPIGYALRDVPILLRRAVRGAPAPVPLVPIRHNDPDRRWWLRMDNRQPSPALQLTGATIQPLFLFTQTQPELGRWYAIRPQPASFLPRIEGPIAAQLFFFPSTQPTVDWQPGRQQDRRIGAKELTGVFTPPAPPQSYVFQPNQPGREWVLRRIPTEQVGAPVRLEGAAAQASQDYLFKVSQPDLRAYQLLQAVRYYGGVVPFLETILPLVGISPSADVVIRVMADVGIIEIRKDVGIILVLPDVGDVEL